MFTDKVLLYSKFSGHKMPLPLPGSTSIVRFLLRLEREKNKISIDEIVPSLHYAGEWRTWNRISLNNFLSMKTSGVCAATALCKCFMCLNNEDGLLVKRTNANTLLSLNSDVWVLIIYNVCLQFCIAGCKANVRKKTRNVQREREIERELKKEVPHIHRLTVG